MSGGPPSGGPRGSQGQPRRPRTPPKKRIYTKENLKVRLDTINILEIVYLQRRPWLRTNGVSANGAAAEVMNSDRLGEKGTPWHFWEAESRLTGIPSRSLCQKTVSKCSDPLSVDPLCPFPNASMRP